MSSGSSDGSARYAREVLDRIGNKEFSPVSEQLSLKTPTTTLPTNDPARWKPQRIISTLGRMSEVVQGIDVITNESVAIKYLRDVVGAKDVHLASQRFEQEASMPNKIQHPNIVPTIGAFTRPHPYDPSSTQHAIVQPFIEHPTLEIVLSRGEGASLDARRFLSQMSVVLVAMQNANVLHRDLHPGNIFVTPDERYLITDFGKARHADSVLASNHGTNVPGEVHRLNYIDWVNLRGVIDPRSDLISTARLATAILRGEHYTRRLQESEFPTTPQLTTFLRTHADEINASMSKDAVTFAHELEALIGGETIVALSSLKRVQPMSTSGVTYVAESPISRILTTDDDYTGEHSIPLNPLHPDLSKLPAHLQENPELLRPYAFTGRRIEDDVREYFRKSAAEVVLEGHRVRYVIPHVQIEIAPNLEHEIMSLEDVKIFFPQYKSQAIQAARSLHQRLVEAGITSDDPRVLSEYGVSRKEQLELIEQRNPRMLWGKERELHHNELQRFASQLSLEANDKLSDIDFYNRTYVMLWGVSAMSFPIALDQINIPGIIFTSALGIGSVGRILAAPLMKMRIIKKYAQQEDETYRIERGS